MVVTANNVESRTMHVYQLASVIMAVVKKGCVQEGSRVELRKIRKKMIRTEVASATSSSRL